MQSVDPSPDERKRGRAVTRSSSPDGVDDWVIDMDATECVVTDIRRLDRYLIERLLTLQRKTKLLLLVDASEDAKFLTNKGARVNAIQQLPTRLLARREYFQLRCSMEETHANEMLTCADTHSKEAEKQFKSDFKGGQKGFVVRFDGACLVQHFI